MPLQKDYPFFLCPAGTGKLFKCFFKSYGF
jgi:hypothetical protein